LVFFARELGVRQLVGVLKSAQEVQNDTKTPGVRLTSCGFSQELLRRARHKGVGVLDIVKGSEVLGYSMLNVVHEKDFKVVVYENVLRVKLEMNSIHVIKLIDAPANLHEYRPYFPFRHRSSFFLLFFN